MHEIGRDPIGFRRSERARQIKSRRARVDFMVFAIVAALHHAAAITVPISTRPHLRLGFLLGGGSFSPSAKVLVAIGIFVAFHIGAFGGLTALNSYYDRDDGPIGGLWQPPRPPKYLWAFAWLVQSSGLAAVLPFDFRLAAIYALIVTLALGYSHSATRWKGHPWKSLAIAAIGQGVCDFAAGVVTAGTTSHFCPAPVAIWCGCAGATAVVGAFYPLTQLFQLNDDRERGDRTTAMALEERFGTDAPFRWAQGFLSLAAVLNLGAITAAKNAGLWTSVLFIAGLGGSLWQIEVWRRAYLRRRQLHAAGMPPSDASAIDFRAVHRLLGLNSLLFALLILVFLLLVPAAS